MVAATRLSDDLVPARPCESFNTCSWLMRSLTKILEPGVPNGSGSFDWMLGLMPAFSGPRSLP